MFPPKAREIIQLNIDEGGKLMPPDVKTALTMAAGAITGILAWRETHDDAGLWNLPGETYE
ncbi:unnamed protein product [marine sediment metagenome]|uniref:Uncharacterized protein n=1 Tax=marine sediment metagenome TaxID=412755 RepID=X1KAY7_9ZZZZ